MGFGDTRPARRVKPTEPANYLPLEEELEHDMGGLGDIHRMWRVHSGTEGSDIQGEGLKVAMVSYCNIWGVGATLVMTVCFSFLLVNPSADMDPDLPLGGLARRLFLFYNMAATLTSVKAISEIASVTEDVALVPASLISEYIAGMKKAGEKFGPAAKFGPDKWTGMALELLLSSGVFLVYCVHGFEGGVMSVIMFAIYNSWTWQTDRFRNLTWRGTEFALWSQPEKQRCHPEEFEAWRNGHHFLWCGGSWANNNDLHLVSTDRSVATCLYLMGQELTNTLKALFCYHTLWDLGAISFGEIRGSHDSSGYLDICELRDDPPPPREDLAEGGGEVEREMEDAVGAGRSKLY